MKITHENWKEHSHKWRNFTQDELMCKCGCGDLQMEDDFLEALQGIRDEVGPMVITSAYRCPQHKVEAKKSSPGSHSKGVAVDVGIEGERALALVHNALEYGMDGIGVSQREGKPRFIHLDQLIAPYRPRIWSY